MFIMASAALLSTLAESTEADRAVTQHFVGGNMKEAKSGDVDFKRPVALKTKRVDIKPISQSGLGDQVVPFIYKAFARDEPMCQASGLGQGSPADQDQNFNGFIEYGSTLGLVAVDEATGNPLAFLTGALVKKGDAADDGGEEEKSLEWSRVEGYFGNARYDPANFATTMPGCEVTYDLEMIAVSSEARGKD